MSDGPLTRFIDSIAIDEKEFFEKIPYAKETLAVWVMYRKRRIGIFLKSIDKASGTMSGKDKEQFNDYISSPFGRELLMEYSDSVLSTSSLIAISALGIIYADINNEIYTDDFKRITCRSLQGVTDGLIEAFILLCDLKLKTEKGPYPLCKLDEDEFESSESLKDRIETSEDAFACIAELIRRGMFLPDHIPSRIAGGKWFINFGVTKTSLEIKKLLLRAKILLEAISK